MTSYRPRQSMYLLKYKHNMYKIMMTEQNSEYSRNSFLKIDLTLFLIAKSWEILSEIPESRLEIVKMTFEKIFRQISRIFRSGQLWTMKIKFCKRQKKWQPCCILNSMLNSNSEVIFQEQRLDCATNMAKKLPVGKFELIYNEFRGCFP